MSVKAGDLIKIIKEGKEIQGILMPSPDEKLLFIKLDSGYTIGIKKQSISSIEKLGEGKTLSKAPLHSIKQNKTLPKIAILHTGGTIASRVDYKSGAVYSSFTPEDLLSMFPELKEIANIESRLISNMWSDDLRFKHFSLLAKEIKKEIDSGKKGIIISIGTDNLAVAAAAISFAVQKPPVPILFVGAQRSSDRPSTDAAMNLISATEFITKTDFSGVAICMHSSSNDDVCSILPATKTKKLHSSRRNAFQVINSMPIARINYNNKRIEFLTQDYLKKDFNRKAIIKENFEEKIALLKVHVNMIPEQFEFYLKHEFKGLVIEGTGLGHTPGQVFDSITASHIKIYPIIKKLINSGCLIVMTSNCVFGRVQMNVYNKGRELQSLGIIPGEDMLPETVLVKLSWLLGNYSLEEAKQLIKSNLVGEINERILEKEFIK